MSFEAKPNNSDGLIEPLIYSRPDICPVCKAQRIEVFSFNGIPQHYTDAVNKYLMGYNVEYNTYEIKYMKCKSCNREFMIDWTSGFPKPLIDGYKLNKFLDEFINGY